MLGRLGFDVEECIDKYTQMSRTAFELASSRELLLKSGTPFDSCSTKRSIEVVLQEAGLYKTRGNDRRHKGRSRGTRT